MDLSQWLEDDRFGHVLELIDQLPATSRFNAARMNDPEFARMVAELPEPDEPWAPSPTEYNLQAQQMAMMIDRLGDVVNAVIVSAGGNSRPYKPFPAPVTEIDRAKTERDRQDAISILTAFGFSEDQI